MQLIQQTYTERGEVSILDVGGTRKYWNIVPSSILEENNVRITVLNFASERFDDSGPFTFVEGNGCDLSEFDDQSFDIVHSNSVLEHVGVWSDMCRFAEETRRVGRKYWVQTPYFWFPVEPHCLTPFFHWLPWSWRVKLVMRFSLGNWARRTTVDAAVRAVESARLVDRLMFRTLFPDARIHSERFCLLTKSVIAVRS